MAFGKLSWSAGVRVAVVMVLHQKGFTPILPHFPVPRIRSLSGVPVPPSLRGAEGHHPAESGNPEPPRPPPVRRAAGRGMAQDASCRVAPPARLRNGAKP